MISIIEAQKRYYANHGWSQVYCLFPANSTHDLGNKNQDLGKNFGNILLINDYTILPGFGYDMHPHQNLEQVFFIIEGELTHQDSLKNTLVLKKGSVQRITAGSGYARSNHNKTKLPARYIGVWLLPKAQNQHPEHDVKEYDPQLWNGAFYPIVSDQPVRQSIPGYPAISFNAAATLYRVTVGPSELAFSVPEGHKALLYVIEGNIVCNGSQMETGAHARISGEEQLQLRSDTKGECLFVLMRTEI
ncbi:Quercetin 2,3-dioxygenase [Leminorella richardii]|uniref:Quercetin 2,3-dioxygenase n=1 Tax=Leminorella richardii TaxID=158841 RepID=A0A2X4UWV9_9GAMM|nr:pirin family protein [Leminorella richardii]SQI39142.1 Quercetin 2,3-dioxygenase [Leminorella richardii]